MIKLELLLKQFKPKYLSSIPVLSLFKLSNLPNCVKKQHFLIPLKSMVLCTMENAYFDYTDGELLAKK